jgi:acetylornithine/succinyldiaminopimelate/putrescine aminotransferase
MGDAGGGDDDRSDILRKGFREYWTFVNPLIAQRAQLAAEPIHLVSTRDGALVGTDGRTYEDFHGTQAFGHRHPAITRAVRAYLDSDEPSWYPSRVNPYAGRLARRLCERSGYSNVYLCLSGSDAVEAALKLARAATRRPGILCLTGAYHGCGFGSTALMAAGPLRDPFGPHLPGVTALPFGDVAALEAALAAGDVGAVVVEPIQGEGGVRPLPAHYVEALCALTGPGGVLLVADEVQTGAGRSGRFLLSAGWPRRPDMVTIAKQLGGGLVPVAAMLCSRELFERAYGRDFEEGESHNCTFSYNALTAVAALAALELLTGDLLARVREVGQKLREDLRSALAGSPLFGEVRGEGLICGIQLKDIDHPWLSMEHFGFGSVAARGRSSIAPLFCHRLYRHGFYCFTCGHDWSVVRVQPRLNVPADVLSRFVQGCRTELDYLASLA